MSDEKKEDNYKIIDIIMKSILLFPILTIIQGINIFSFINKIMMTIVLIEILVSFRDLKYKPRDFFIIFLSIIIHLLAFIYTDIPIYNINMVFYLMFWVLFYIFCSRNREKIEYFFHYNCNYIYKVVIIWSIIIIVSLFFSISYVNGAFVSFSGTSFRLMPTVLLITSLVFCLISLQNKKKYYLLLLLPIFCTFMSFSRVYFLMFALYIFGYIIVKNNNAKTLFIITIITLISLLVIPNTPIGEKFTNTSYTEESYYDFWGTITSGRSVFWEIDLKQFNKLPLFNKLVGNGYNFVYDVNAIYHGNKIWAHNDIINILMNFGYVGVFIYLYSLLVLLKNYFKGNIPYYLCILAFLAIFINSNINMSYTYLCAMISYPILILGFNFNYQKKEGKENER